MVRVQVGQQQRVERAPGRAGGDQALRHAGATIDEDFRVVSENELSRPVTLRRNHRTAGAEKDDFHDAKLTERRRDAMEKGPSQGRPLSVGSSAPRSPIPATPHLPGTAGWVLLTA